MEFTAILPVPATLADNKLATFSPLVGESPLVRVVLTALDGAARVIVAAAGTIVEDCRKSLAGRELSSVEVIPVAGTGARAHCLAAALDSSSAPIVVVHDVRRPLASPALQARVVAELVAGSPIVMPAVPLTDSVKAIDTHGSVTATVDRSTLRAVQYPRGFTTDQLSGLLAGRASDEFDELEEALAADMPITIVEGELDAFVVELPRDTAFVEAIIASRQ